MCEFCKYGERNQIVDTEPSKPTRWPVEFWIQESDEAAKNKPKLIAFIDNLYVSMDVKYCPICGRKLENYSEEENENNSNV